MHHPFAGRKGSEARDRYAAKLFVAQGGVCGMCSQPVNATLRGKREADAAVVDHIRPWRLRPDLAHDEANLWLLCRACHAKCDGIEKRHAGDAEEIAKAKAGKPAVGLDGWPTR